jgi:hypothetical protein
LLVPCQIARQTGAIVAIARGPDDPSIQAARAIAAAAKEDFIVIEISTGKYQVAASDWPAGARIIPAPMAQGVQVSGPVIASALRHEGERLVVMTRDDNSIPLDIASLRQVPVLIVEPRGNQSGNVRNSRPEPDLSPA